MPSTARRRVVHRGDELALNARADPRDRAGAERQRLLAQRPVDELEELRLRAGQQRRGVAADDLDELVLEAEGRGRLCT